MRRQGQHFLISREIGERIAGYANLRRSDMVLEIGPGRGFLTEFLAARAGKVYAIEVDPELASGLQGRFSNVEVVKGDALRVSLPGYNKIVSNLPYQISSDITYRLLPRPFELAVLMYQREFAERMLARPGMPNYGKLSVITSHYARAEITEHVKRSAFRPEPHVDSSIVRLWPREDRPEMDERLFMNLVTSIFNNRRKKLKNALASAGLAREKISGLDEEMLRLRPEELAPEEISELVRAVSRSGT